MEQTVQAGRPEGQANPSFHKSRDATRRDYVPETGRSRTAEKSLWQGILVIVPQTDTGGQGENPEALERTLVKELGKITP